jgi:hypothetical protein
MYLCPGIYADVVLMNNSVEYLRRHSGGHFRLVPPLANGKTPLRRRPVISYHLSRQFIPRLTCNCELSWSRHAIAASVLGGGVSSANSPLLAPLIVTDNSLPRNKFLPIAEILSGPSRGGVACVGGRGAGKKRNVDMGLVGKRRGIYF